MRKILLCLLVLAMPLAGCTGVPKGIEPINDFELQKYYGKWYEVARLDHRFERGLQNVTAEYSPREDGLVEVVNRGYKTTTNEWKQAIGKARFKSDPALGHLLVSFFGPFYASYVIFELNDYQEAYVVGSNRKNLWYLSRTPQVSEVQKTAFLEKAQALGFDTSSLIWVVQSIDQAE